MKSFEVTDLPVRAAKFVVRKSWIVAGSVCTLYCDDMVAETLWPVNPFTTVGLRYLDLGVFINWVSRYL